MTLTQQYPQYVVPFLESKLNEVSGQYARAMAVILPDQPFPSPTDCRSQ
jgi:hypothetical protein